MQHIPFVIMFKKFYNIEIISSLKFKEIWREMLAGQRIIGLLTNDIVTLDIAKETITKILSKLLSYLYISLYKLIINNKNIPFILLTCITRCKIFNSFTISYFYN